MLLPEYRVSYKLPFLLVPEDSVWRIRNLGMDYPYRKHWDGNFITIEVDVEFHLALLVKFQYPGAIIRKIDNPESLT